MQVAITLLVVYRLQMQIVGTLQFTVSLLAQIVTNTHEKVQIFFTLSQIFSFSGHNCIANARNCRVKDIVFNLLLIVFIGKQIMQFEKCMDIYF